MDVLGEVNIIGTLLWGIGPAIVATIIMMGLKLRNYLAGDHKDPSLTVKKTTLARLDGGLPVDLSLIAEAGRKGEAPRTFQEHYLRPTIGLRAIMLGFPVLLYFILGTLEEQSIGMEDDPLTLWASLLLFAIMVHNIIYFFTYELRYDDVRIIHRSWFYRSVALKWSELLTMRDDGMYLYILRSQNGKKAYVPKHLIGIEDFVRTVNAAIARNDSY